MCSLDLQLIRQICALGIFKVFSRGRDRYFAKRTESSQEVPRVSTSFRPRVRAMNCADCTFLSKISLTTLLHMID